MTGRPTESLPAGYFEKLYAADPDPWRFASSRYEAEKYAATLAALPSPRFSAAFEVGCSIGVLTRRLAVACDRILAVDVVPSALEQARDRCADLPHVRFAEMRVPADWPDETFDLMLFSEVLYYLDADDLRTLGDRVRATLAPGGAVVLVHWTGLTDYPMTGDAAADGFIAAARRFARPVRRDRAVEYRLDVLVRDD